MKMNKSLTLVFLSILFISCSSNENNMVLSGTVKGLKKGTLYLQKIKDSTLITLDSVVINGNSSFQFNEPVLSPEIYYLHVKIKDGILQDDRISFFAEPKEINITTTLQSFSVDARIIGSENENKYKEYTNLMERFKNRNLELIENHLIARQNGNDSLAGVFENSQKSELSKRYLATINFALNNSGFEVAPYLMVSHVRNTREKYLDTVYQKLPQKIKDSKYGKDLESLINSRKTTSQE